MTHLSPDQLIDLVEGHADRGAVAHREACDHCRAEVDALRATLALATTDPAHEPSPLFWDHFSSRVGAAVRAEAGARERRSAWRWRWGSVAALSATVLVAALTVMPRGTVPVEPDAAGRSQPSVAGDVTPVVAPPSSAGVSGGSAADTAAADATAALGVADEPAAGDDAPWVFVRDLSEEFSVEAASVALPAGPGAADRALADLTGEERAALVDLIRAELARASERNPESLDR